MITNVENGYIVSFQQEGNNDAEYKEAIKVMDTRPVPPQGFDYRLKADSLEWELYELEESEVENEY